MPGAASRPARTALSMLKRIRIAQLREGMYVHKIEGSWLEHSFWRSSFAVKERKIIESLRASGIAEVWIDTDKGLDVAKAASGASATDADAPSGEPARIVLPGTRTTLGEEVAAAKKVYAKSRVVMRSLFTEARLGRAIDTGEAEALVDEIASSLQRNPWALVSVARLKTADEYTYMHCVAVCALMMALARHLGMDEREGREAGLAGMMHDLGKAKMPLDILNKPGRLTDEEFAVMKGHSEAGYKMLLEMGGGEVALEVCLHHHEKLDGTGYPHGLSGEQISRYARMGAVCDVYDAVTSNRPYKKGWDPAEALKRMATWDGHFDQHIFHAFVKSVGIYPIGSFVRLESGLMGVVVEQNEGSLLRPKVRTFFSAKSRAYVLPKIIDLAQSRSDDRILGPERPDAWGIARVADFLA